MNTSAGDKLPLPNCWQQSWHEHALKNGLHEFPTRQHFESYPSDSRPFCLWIWRQLIKAEGSMCDSSSAEACENCQRSSVSKIISLRILSLIVKNEDPTLHFILDRKFNLMKNGYPHVRKGRRPYVAPEPPPADSPHPLPPLAVNMPRPMPPITTYLVARELRNKPWLREWLNP
jgi:hypothetical protein